MRDESDKLTVLILSDRDTGLCAALPTQQKGGKSLHYLVTEMCRFVVQCGHTTVGFRCDSEPSTLALLEAAKRALAGLNITVYPEPAPTGDHRANGAAEAMVGVIRNKANLLVAQIEEATGCKEPIFGCIHPVYSWAIIHSCWIHNRYVVKQTMTSFERATGRHYSGKVACFGEVVMGYLRQSLKGLPSWCKGIWLSKSATNDCHILGTAKGLFITRSIRRLPDPFQLEPLGELTTSPWDYGYASLGHRLVYARRSAPPVGVAIGSELNLGDKDALAVRDYARAHPFEDVEPQALSAEAGAVPIGDGAEDAQPDSSGQNLSGLPDSNMLHGDSAPVTPVEHGEKHETEHDVEGGMAKRSHVESSPSHGDVVPQTPVESGEPVLDDTPFDQMASPQKTGRHGDGPGRVNLLGCIRNIECLDIEPDVALQCDDVDTLIQHELNLNEDPYEEGLDLDASLKELSFPYSAEEPAVSHEEPQRLDAIADMVEVQRLFGLEVLQDDTLPQETKSLSTRFVRTWREKKDQAGNPIWLRRSRLVAREYTWLQPDRESLFSPASSNIASRILPICFLSLREHQDTVMASIDFKDAFLTGKQEVPTRVSCTDALGSTTTYSLGRVLPGQRDGSLLWYRDLAGCLKECSLKMSELQAYPSLLKSQDGSCFLLVHVDDLLVVGSRKSVFEDLVPELRKKYNIAIEAMSKGGDEISFLKRTHCLMDDGRLLIKCHQKHLGQLCKLLHMSPKLHCKKTPGHSEIENPDNTNEPSGEDASIYRSCVGILLYLSGDLPQCQYVIRYLSTFSSKPTQKSMVVLKHLVGYMCGHADDCVSLKWKGIHGGVFKSYESDTPMLEIFSDADWAADRQTRRSVSGSMIFFVSCLVYSSSRTQKVVSLSSAESETYAAASAVMDAVLIHTIFTWLLQLQIVMCLHLDSSASRGILSRKGVGRLRHLSCRVLWMQNLVSEKILLVKAVLGTINPADVATKRLSASRLQSLRFFIGLWSGSSNNLVGSQDPAGIFRHVIPSRQQIRSIMGTLSALGTLAQLSQLQGCNLTVSPVGSSAMDTGAADGQFEVKFMITWLLMLVGYGVYLNLTLGCRKGDFVPADDGADGFSTSGDSGNFSVPDVSSEIGDEQGEWEPPAFSPEGLLFWLYRRCSGREERAAANHDVQRLERYQQRKVALQDMLNFLHHASPVEYQRAHEMLHTISDLSEDETSPQDDDQHGGIDLGAGAASAVAAGMSMGLMGCASDGPSAQGQTSLPVLVLVTWTVLCMGYTWGPWHQLGVDGPKPIDTMAVREEPQTEDRGVDPESLVTYTMIRVLRRLGRASRAGNNGKLMKYHQWKRWLCTFVVHLPGSPAERERMVETLVVDHPLSDDEESPTHNLPDDAKALLVRSAGAIYGHIMGLLENTTVENAIQMLTVYGEAMRTPEPMPAGDMDDDDDDDDDGDESMGHSETEAERRRRYANAPMEECSDPEYWALVHYGPGESDEAEEF
eukprot:s4269_g2.t1